MRNSPVLRNSTLVRRTSALAAAATAALVLAGCGSDEPSTAQDPAADASSAAPTTSAPAEPSQPPASAASSPAETVPPAGDALITLDAPAQGATVSGSFEAKGTANSPEANVPWRILDAGGAKVLDGYFTAEGWMDKLYPYAGTVDVSSLAPGSYTFEVSVDDPSGGEGKPPQKVARSITVQ